MDTLHLKHTLAWQFGQMLKAKMLILVLPAGIFTFLPLQRLNGFYRTEKMKIHRTYLYLSLSQISERCEHDVFVFYFHIMCKTWLNKTILRTDWGFCKIEPSVNQTPKHILFFTADYIILGEKTRKEERQGEVNISHFFRVIDRTATRPRHISDCVNQRWCTISAACASEGHCWNSSYFQTKV